MSNFANKSVGLKANLKEGVIKYFCYPSDEFKKGQWLIAIGSMSFISKENFAVSCTLKSNFVTTQKRSSNGEIKTYQDPLVVFQLSAAAQKVGVSRFSNKIIKNQSN